MGATLLKVIERRKLIGGDVVECGHPARS
jgi:hypothetical protein